MILPYRTLYVFYPKNQAYIEAKPIIKTDIRKVISPDLTQLTGIAAAILSHTWIYLQFLKSG